MDQELKEVRELWAGLREEFVRDWLNKEGSYGGGYTQMADDEGLVLYRLAAALRAAHAAGRAEGREKAAAHIDVPWARDGREFAAAIRALK